MKKNLLSLFILLFATANVFADAVVDVSTAPSNLNNLAPGTTVQFFFSVEIEEPFGGSSNACTVWDVAGITIPSSTNIDNSSLAFAPNPDGCPAAITLPVPPGCPNPANTAVSGSLSFTIDPSATTGAWNVMFDIEYYRSATGCATISYSLAGTVLPVELVSFDAQAKKEGVEVSWITASEVNNDFFTLERSLDGRNFETVSEIAGAGFSDAEIQYGVVDTEILNMDAGFVYYRLKQTDFDGTKSYSKVVTVRLDSDKTIVTTVTATSNQTVLSINAASDKDVEITVFDVNGRRMMQQEEFLIEGDNTIEMSHNAWPTGIYLYHVRSGNQVTTTKIMH